MIPKYLCYVNKAKISLFAYSIFIPFKRFKNKINFFHIRKNHNFPLQELDLNYICNPANADDIRINIKNRKGFGDIDKVLELNGKIENLKQKVNLDDSDKKLLQQLQNELLYEANNIPNKTHPEVLNRDDHKELGSFGEKTEFKFEPEEFHFSGKNLGVLRMDRLGQFSNERSYQFKGNLAKLEHALINFCVERLIKKGFDLITVPDILHPQILERCGMITAGNPHTQIYHIKPSLLGPASLSGTAEMALAAYFINSNIPYTELPQKKVAVSRCFRSEIGGRIKSEKGIYRVHQFTKVEMFGVTANETENESQDLLDEFFSIQKEFLSDIGLHFKALDMSSTELAAAAYRKYDIEAWMPARGLYGEVTSASNCTDYQSRRLNIKYSTKDGNLKFAHTVNGTACAIPRLLLSIFETYQNEDGSITIPKILQPYMDGLEKIDKNTPPEIMYYMITEKKLKKL